MNTYNTLKGNLKEKWNQLKLEQPHIKIRDAAQRLEVSEADLLITKIGEGITVLKPHFKEILLEIESLGKLMALTRNEECVHEKKGIYLNGDFSNPHAQLFVGEDIDLRIFLTAWKYAFAVEEGQRKSLQFFGKDGGAVHKIYTTKNTDYEAFDRLVQKYKDDYQDQEFIFEPFVAKLNQKPDEEIDVEEFRKAWLKLKDTHDFFMMTKKFGVTRNQALRFAPSGFARKIDPKKVENLLETSSIKKLPIMVFVGNRGVIQIHTGFIDKVLWYNSWINVMDPDFSLHLNTEKIHEIWIVKKPTQDGGVHSVEVFNKKGDMIVQFFGKRKPGIPELQEWRDLLEDLSK